MKRFATLAVIAGFTTLAACGDRSHDAAAENIEQSYDNAADALDAKADAMRAEGERKEKAIDAADVDPAATNQAMLNGM